MTDDPRQQPSPQDHGGEQLEEARKGLIVSPAMSVQPAATDAPMDGMPAPAPVDVAPQTPAAQTPSPPEE
jgi:hypothetical protein